MPLRCGRLSSITSKCFIIASDCTVRWAIKHRLILKPPTTDLKKSMKTGADSAHSKKRPPHLTYSAFCLAAKAGTTDFLQWISTAKGAHCLCPVKQKRALLESNLPRDSWIERRRNKTVSTSGEAKTSPKVISETSISEPEHAFQNSSNTVSKSSKSFRNGHWLTKPLEKNHLSSYPFFRSKPNKGDDKGDDKGGDKGNDKRYPPKDPFPRLSNQRNVCNL